MTLEEPQISDTHSLKGVGDDNLAVFRSFQLEFLTNLLHEIIPNIFKYVLELFQMMTVPLRASDF